MIDIVEFEKLVQLDAPSGARPLITFMVKRSIIEFCEKSWILFKDFSMTLDAADINTSFHNSVDIDLSEYVTDLRPVAVLRLYIDGIEWQCEYVDLAQDTEITAYETVFSTTDSKQITFVNDYTLRIYKVDAAASEIYLRMSFKPLMANTEVDDILYEDWVEPIIAGAKARILALPGRDWTDPQTAAMNYRFFRMGISEAKRRLQKNFADQEHRAEWQIFGGVEE